MTTTVRVLGDRSFSSAPYLLVERMGGAAGGGRRVSARRGGKAARGIAGEAEAGARAPLGEVALVEEPEHHHGDGVHAAAEHEGDALVLHLGEALDLDAVGDEAAEELVGGALVDDHHGDVAAAEAQRLGDLHDPAGSGGGGESGRGARGGRRGGSGGAGGRGSAAHL